MELVGKKRKQKKFEMNQTNDETKTINGITSAHWLLQKDSKTSMAYYAAHQKLTGGPLRSKTISKKKKKASRPTAKSLCCSRLTK